MLKMNCIFFWCGLVTLLSDRIRGYKMSLEDSLEVGIVDELVEPASLADVCSRGFECSHMENEEMDGYDIRTFPRGKWLNLDIDPAAKDDHLAFLKLLRYFEGLNDQGVYMTPTIPLVYRVSLPEDGSALKRLSVKAYIPQAYQDDTPIPLDTDLYITTCVGERVYSKALYGNVYAWMGSKQDSKKAVLGQATMDIQTLENHGLTFETKVFGHASYGWLTTGTQPDGFTHRTEFFFIAQM